MPQSRDPSGFISSVKRCIVQLFNAPLHSHNGALCACPTHLFQPHVGGHHLVLLILRLARDRVQGAARERKEQMDRNIVLSFQPWREKRPGARLANQVAKGWGCIFPAPPTGPSVSLLPHPKASLVQRAPRRTHGGTLLRHPEKSVLLADGPSSLRSPL